MVDLIGSDSVLIKNKDIKKIRPSNIDLKMSSVFAFAPSLIEEDKLDKKRLISESRYAWTPCMFYVKEGKIHYLVLDKNTHFMTDKIIYTVNVVYPEGDTLPSSRFLFSQMNKPKPKIEKEISEECLQYISKKVVLRDDATLVFLSLWCIASYFFDAYQTFPYVHFNGDYGAGKSRALEVCSYCSYYGHLQIDLTPASIFRQIDAVGSTMCFDEQEDLWAVNKSSDAIRVLAILNAGYTSGSTVPRTDIENNVVGEFRVYSPKQIASIAPIEYTLASRCVLIPMRKMGEEIDKLQPHVEEMADFRDKMYLYRLWYGSDFMEGYRNWLIKTSPHKTYNLTQRFGQLFLPMVYTAIRFRKSWMEPLLEFIDFQRKLKMSSKRTSLSSYIMECLNEHVKATLKRRPDDKETWIKVKTVKAYLVGTEYENLRQNKISAAIDTLGFRETREGIGGHSSRKIPHKVVAEYYEAIGERMKRK